MLDTQGESRDGPGGVGYHAGSLGDRTPGGLIPEPKAFCQRFVVRCCELVGDRLNRSHGEKAVR